MRHSGGLELETGEVVVVEAFVDEAVVVEAIVDLVVVEEAADPEVLEIWAFFL